MSKQSIRDELKAAGVTAAEIARGLGVSPAAVSQWEELPAHAADWLRDLVSERDKKSRAEVVVGPIDVTLKTERTFTREELLKLALRRGKEKDWEIARSVGVAPHLLKRLWGKVNDV